MTILMAYYYGVWGILRCEDWKVLKLGGPNANEPSEQRGFMNRFVPALVSIGNDDNALEKYMNSATSIQGGFIETVEYWEESLPVSFPNAPRLRVDAKAFVELAKMYELSES